ncbi:MAG: alpha/beta fold hydrolase [Halobacteria archaeon]
MKQYDAEREVVQTSTLEFETLVCDGGGKDVLLLHGFPDDPGSMVPLMERFEERGFRAVAPYMRGYGGTEKPEIKPGAYSVTKLSQDIMALFHAFEMDDPVLVGHDWGAVASTVVSRLAPGNLDCCITMGVPPDFMETLGEHPEQILRSWYMMFFQVPGVAEDALRRNDYRLLERLYRGWSHGWDYRDRVEEVRDTFRSGETVEASLMYYRDFFDEHVTGNEDLQVRGIETPSLVMAGGQDGCVSPRLFNNSERCFDGYVDVEVIDGAGHFMHVSDVEKVWSRIEEFLDQ